MRGTLKKAAKGKIKFLWTPYARSVPDTGPNALGVYFPGKTNVDYVGADAYNFGAAKGLSWTEPAGLFTSAYATIQALAPKPFWIGETGTTAAGGDKAAWILALAGLQKSMPKLSAVLWYDVKDPNGDFRATSTSASAKAFKNLVKGACK